jgi:hypothetical protein
MIPANMVANLGRHTRKPRFPLITMFSRFHRCNVMYFPSTSIRMGEPSPKSMGTRKLLNKRRTCCVTYCECWGLLQRTKTHLFATTSVSEEYASIETSSAERSWSRNNLPRKKHLVLKIKRNHRDVSCFETFRCRRAATNTSMAARIPRARSF